MADLPATKIFERDLKVGFAVSDTVLAHGIGHRTDDGASGHSTNRIGHSMQDDIRITVTAQRGGVTKNQAA